MLRLYFSIKELFLSIVIAFFPFYSTLAESRNKPVLAYFTDNIIARIIISGGYYSLAVIVVLLLASWIFKGFRTIFFSVCMALFGIFLLIFVFEAMDNMEWIPPVYS